VRVLTVNAGSSSLKLRLLGDDDQLLARADLPALAGRAAQAELGRAIAGLPEADVIAHRVVHGGTRFTGPARLDDEAIEALRALTPLAPLHQPAALDAIAAVGALLGDLPAVACIDTAFHAGLPAAASTYALPREWSERHGLKRYGFHGLSHAYVARRVEELLGAGLRIVSCHLGAGASLTAIADGRSVDTTMGFTPVEGLVMATRSGSVDPGMLLWLLQHGGVGVDDLADALEHRSGLTALAGTADMRAVLAAAARGEEAAVLARDAYVHRLRALIAAMAAALGGLDVLVFTGGVGERAGEIRTRAVDGLDFLGASVRTLVIEAREDLEMARQARACL
jgi:acetate kinase